jgi:hypothetical protein
LDGGDWARKTRLWLLLLLLLMLIDRVSLRAVLLLLLLVGRWGWTWVLLLLLLLLVVGGRGSWGMRFNGGDAVGCLLILDQEWVAGMGAEAELSEEIIGVRAKVLELEDTIVLQELTSERVDSETGRV